MGLLKGFMLLVWFLLLDAAELAAGNVVLIGKNLSLSFDAVEANFAPAIKGSGECGILYLAEPLDACTLLQNKVPTGSDSPFVLIVRGGCTFDEKVRRAQEAGFKAAIVYNNEDRGSLVAMSGSPGGIHIHATFVSKFSGETLKNYVSCTVTELWIIPTFENSAWTILAISFISLLAMSAVLATCFFVRRHRIRHEQPRAPNIREFHGMSRRLVKSMPSLVFTSVLEDNCTSATCAICLEDYSTGEKLRILPCRHMRTGITPWLGGDFRIKPRGDAGSGPKWHATQCARSPVCYSSMQYVLILGLLLGEHSACVQARCQDKYRKSTTLGAHSTTLICWLNAKFLNLFIYSRIFRGTDKRKSTSVTITVSNSFPFRQHSPCTKPEVL